MLAYKIHNFKSRLSLYVWCRSYQNQSKIIHHARTHTAQAHISINNQDQVQLTQCKQIQSEQ